MSLLMPAPDEGALARRTEIVAALRAIVPGEGVIADEASLRPWETDGLTAYRQVPLVVVLPETVAQVSAVLRWCHAHEVKVVPRGAGTGLSGGALPLADGVLLGLGIAYVLREKATPGPDYRVLVSDREFEIRSYPPITVAETVIKGARKDALNQGFRRLADYIFAKSRRGEELPMTVPVLQDGGNPMASDPPRFDDEVEGGWRVRFVMPEGHDVPEPPAGVSIIDVPARRVGAATFHGTAHDDRLAAAEDRLRGWLKRHGEDAIKCEPEFAFYNSPMIPPPLRRNEVLLALN